MLQEVSQEDEKTDVKGFPINEKLIKVFQDLTYGIFKVQNLEKLLNHWISKFLKVWKLLGK